MSEGKPGDLVAYSIKGNVLNEYGEGVQVEIPYFGIVPTSDDFKQLYLPLYREYQRHQEKAPASSPNVKQFARVFCEVQAVEERTDRDDHVTRNNVLASQRISYTELKTLVKNVEQQE